MWRAYLDVMRLLLDRLQRQLVEDSDLLLPEYEILVQLSEADDHTLRMAQLADMAVSSRSRLTHTVTRMEERGLVRREPCPDDGRGVLCTLTIRGFDTLVDAAPGHVEAVRAAIFDPLTQDDVASLGAAMDRVRAVLREG